MNKLNKVAAWYFLVSIGTCASVFGAETGDFDGDGRLTIRDVRRVMAPRSPELCNLEDIEERVYPLPGREFAPGSDDAFRAYPCPLAVESCARHFGRWPASVYLEVLRRAVPDGLPSYSPMHWVDEWATAPPAPPLDVDQRFSARLLSVSQSQDDEDRVELEMVLTVEEPVVAFSLLIEADGGAIRTPWLYHTEGVSYWDAVNWSRDFNIHWDGAEQGDLTVRVPVVGYLISGGRYVVTYGLRTLREGSDPVIEPGEYRVLLPARLPKGTPPGSISLELLDTSQVLFQDGTVSAPRVESAGEIVVDREVVDGWDEGVPPLLLDPVERRVHGEVRFRVADERGEPVASGQPVATGMPGDLVRLRVQMRTETPLNYIHFRLRFPQGLLSCGSIRVVLEDPEHPGEPVPAGRNLDVWPQFCDWGLAELNGWFYIGGSHSPAGVASDLTTHGDRAWEYFKPLGEWLDLMEFEVRIWDRATGDVPLLFRRPDRSDPNDRGPDDGDVRFAPYFAQQLCFDRGSKASSDPESPTPNWQYDVVYEDGFIQVVDPPDPPELPDAGLLFELGNVTGAPGETVEVPVVVSWDPEYSVRWHTLAIESDPSAVVVTAVDIPVEARRTPDDIRRLRILQPRSVPRQNYRECLSEEECALREGVACCWWGRQSADFNESALRHAAILFYGYHNEPQPLEIARLRIEIQPDAPPGTYELIPARVPTTDHNGVPVIRESGALTRVEGVPTYIQAAGVIGGLIHVAAPFRRGDSNQDGKEDIADAVHSLGFLFADAPEPPCLDAADVNDDGTVNLTDPIFLLGTLFGGGGEIPEPVGRCGSDPTDDRIRCERSVCAE